MDAELIACALMSAQADGDYDGMRQIMDHVSGEDRQAMLNLIMGEIAERDHGRKEDGK